ncbi:hypothetical protein MEO41_27650, partial [Dolichospermum sp. ST_sed4]|nr:hypothetical protein [Dolichospermum sp. ST_sed4]
MNHLNFEIFGFEVSHFIIGKVVENPALSGQGVVKKYLFWKGCFFLNSIILWQSETPGEMAEWLKAQTWKVCNRVTYSGV